MRDDLDDLIARAREALRPSAGATERARDAVRAATPAPRRRWSLPARRGRFFAVAAAALVLGGGAAGAVVGITSRDGGPPFRPTIENCYALEGYTLRTPRLHPQVAIDGSGNATAAWVDLAGVVRAADRPAGEAWEDSVELAVEGRQAPTRVALSANSDGQAAVAWFTAGRAWVVERPAGGDWEEPVDLTRAGQTVVPAGADAPSVLVTEAGDVVVGWESVASSAVRRTGSGIGISGDSPHPELAVRAAGGAWRALPLQGSAQSVPALAEGDAGRVAVTYLAELGGVAVTEVDLERGAAAGSRSLRLPRTSSARGFSIGSPRIAGDGKGTLALTLPVNGQIALWTRDAPNGWGPGRVVSPVGLESSEPSVDVSREGEVLVAWTGLKRERRADGTLRAARAIYAALPGRVADEPSEAIRLSRPGRVATGAAVAFPSRGVGLVAWADGTNGVSGRDSRVEAARLADDGRSFERGEPLSGVGTGPLFPDVDASEDGQAVAAWTRCVEADSAEVQAADVDAGGVPWGEPARVFP
jgi:hypothetical protein